MSKFTAVSVIDEEQVSIQGIVFEAEGQRYIVGYSEAHPVLAIQVGNKCNPIVDIHLEYDEASLKAAKQLVAEIEEGIKERNDA